MRLFITGTDTAVGKTFVTALLVRALQRAGVDAVGFKPICCGGREDAELLCAASGGALSLNDVNPVWLRAPLAPYAASLVEGRAVDLDLVRDTFARLSAAHASVIVEGVGGWRVPITRDYAVSDLAAELGLPVAVVVANRLGALSHARLTVEAIAAHGLECAGIILNHTLPPTDAPDLAVATNRGVLEELLEVPILYDIAHCQPALELRGVHARRPGPTG